jgi:hypothetical protein
MVMRNRHDGANAPEWWDDLPPKIRKRFTSRPRPEASASADDRLDWQTNDPNPAHPRLARDLSLFLVLFLAVAIAILMFLLVAVSYLAGHGLLLQ